MRPLDNPQNLNIKFLGTWCQKTSFLHQVPEDLLLSYVGPIGCRFGPSAAETLSLRAIWEFSINSTELSWYSTVLLSWYSTVLSSDFYIFNDYLFDYHLIDYYFNAAFREGG